MSSGVQKALITKTHQYNYFSLRQNESGTCGFASLGLQWIRQYEYFNIMDSQGIAYRHLHSIQQGSHHVI